MVKIHEGGNLHTAPACPTQYIPNIDIADLHCLRFSGGTHLTTQDIGLPSNSFLIVWGCHVGQVGILDSVWHHLDSSLQEFLLFMLY